MSEEERLLKEVDRLLEDFKSSEPYQRYRKLKDEVDQNERLNQLIESRKALQKGLRYRDETKKREALLAAKKLQEEYDNDPLVVNLKAQEKEVKDRLRVLTEEKL